MSTYSVSTELPVFRPVLRNLIKSQIQHLIDQLAADGEEDSFLVTACATDVNPCVIGSEKGLAYMQDFTGIAKGFVGYLQKEKAQMNIEPQASGEIIKRCPQIVNSSRSGQPGNYSISVTEHIHPEQDLFNGSNDMGHPVQTVNSNPRKIIEPSVIKRERIRQSVPNTPQSDTNVDTRNAEAEKTHLRSDHEAMESNSMYGAAEEINTCKIVTQGVSSLATDEVKTVNKIKHASPSKAPVGDSEMKEQTASDESVVKENNKLVDEIEDNRVNSNTTGKIIDTKQSNVKIETINSKDVETENNDDKNDKEEMDNENKKAGLERDNDKDECEEDIASDNDVNLSDEEEVLSQDYTEMDQSEIYSNEPDDVKSDKSQIDINASIGHTSSSESMITDTRSEVQADTSKVKKKTNSRSIQCKICYKNFNSMGYHQHQLSHFNTKTYKCHYCKSTFKKIDTLKGHMSKKHKGKNFVYTLSKVGVKPKKNQSGIAQTKVTNSKEHLKPNQANLKSDERADAQKERSEKYASKAKAMKFVNPRSILFEGKYYRVSLSAKDLKCNVCFKTSRTLSEFKEHEYHHTKIFECYRCGIQFKDRGDIRGHVMKCSVVPMFLAKRIVNNKLQVVKKKYPTVSISSPSENMQGDAQKNTSVPVPPTETNTEKSPTISTAKPVEHNDKTVTMGTSNNTVTMGTRGSSEKLTLFTCPKCQRKFKYRISLKKHACNPHGKSTTSPATSPNEKTKTKLIEGKKDEMSPESSKTPTKKILYQDLLKMEIKDKECPVCGKSQFKSVHAVREHLVSHADTDERPFQCHLCPKSFRWDKDRKYHEKMKHSSTVIKKNELPFKGKARHSYPISTQVSSVRTDRLLRRSLSGEKKEHKNARSFMEHFFKHNKKHNKIISTSATPSKEGTMEKNKNVKSTKLLAVSDRKYICPYKNCGKSYQNNGHLEDHLVFHTCEKRYECSACNVRFLSRGHFYKHKRDLENQGKVNCHMVFHKRKLEIGDIIKSPTSLNRSDSVAESLTSDIASPDKFMKDFFAKTFTNIWEVEFAVSQAVICKEEEKAEMVRCNMCGKEFHLELELKQHLFAEHFEGDANNENETISDKGKDPVANLSDDFPPVLSPQTLPAMLKTETVDDTNGNKENTGIVRVDKPEKNSQGTKDMNENQAPDLEKQSECPSATGNKKHSQAEGKNSVKVDDKETTQNVKQGIVNGHDNNSDNESELPKEENSLMESDEDIDSYNKNSSLFFNAIEETNSAANKNGKNDNDRDDELRNSLENKAKRKLPFSPLPDERKHKRTYYDEDQ